MTTLSKETTKTTTSNPVLLFGDLSKDYLQITVFRRSYPETVDYWDANWLDCHLKVVAAPFEAEFLCQLRTDEFDRFRESMQKFSEELQGLTKIATFASGQLPEFQALEPWISIQTGTNGHGYFWFHAEIRYKIRSPHMLQMGINFTAENVPTYLAQLEAIVQAFPVVGKYRLPTEAPSSNG